MPVCSVTSTSTSKSDANDADIVVDGLGGELMPFQRGSVAYALEKRHVILGDEVGLGKTVIALATVQAAMAFPVVIVCPASLKENWAREARKWIPSRADDVRILSGTKPDGPITSSIAILNYDILSGWLPQVLALQPKCVILDEAHAIKNRGSQRSKAAEILCKGKPVLLFLSGTSILNRPNELIHQLKCLDRLKDLGGFWAFANRYCGATRDRWGLHLDGATHLDELSAKLRATCYVRHKKSEVLKDLPDKRHCQQYFGIDNREEYTQCFKDTARWFAEKRVQEESFLQSISDMPEAERDAAIALKRRSEASRILRAEKLARIEGLKQVAANGKLKAVIDWVNLFLDGGDGKLVLFAHHVDILNKLMAAFPDAAHILGVDTIEERQNSVDRFQSEATCRLLIGSMGSTQVGPAAQGWTLTAANNVAIAEFPWTPAIVEQAEGRCHRIGQGSSEVTCWNLIASNTIDEDIIKMLDAKRDIVQAVLQGGAAEQSEADLLEELMGAFIVA
jgi:SNF2 family DNA or RNA helicase